MGYQKLMNTENKNILFFYTNAFPCDKALEHYIEHEMPFLAESFTHIYIFPGDYSEIKIAVPDNVSVINIYDAKFYNSSFFRLLIAFPYLMRVMASEFLNTKVNKWIWLKKSKSSFIALYNALECANATKVFINVNNFKINSIYFYSYWLYHPALFLSILKDKNIINSFVSRGHQAEVYDYAYPEKNTFKYFKLNHVSKVFLISEHARNYLCETYPKFKQKFEVSYLGVKDHGLNPEKSEVFTIVSCSKFAPHKRIHLIVEALRGIDFNYKWYHLGYIPDAVQAQFKNQLQENRNKEIFFPGDLSNQKVLEFYKTTPIDIFINVSSIEGLSVAIMEAISFGIPAVGTDINGTREIVTDKSGYLLPINFDTRELAETMKHVQRKTETIKRVGARQLFLEKFNAETNFNFFIKNGLLKSNHAVNVN